MNDRTNKRKLKKPVCNANLSHFSIESYYIWFCALIFITELIVDIWLATYYFNKNQTQWGIITLVIIVVSLVVCQMYSLWLLRNDSIRATAIVSHVLLLGIPYRYHKIWRSIDKDKMINQDIEMIKKRIRDVNSIQTLNVLLQYCPQFLFQVFLIIYRKYKCVITGVSAGLAGFSLICHICIHFLNCFKRYNDQIVINNSNTRIIDNLSNSGNDSGNHNSSIISNNIGVAPTIITDNLKNFEKPMYKTDDNNLVSKKNGPKNVDKLKIFSFNKRKPIYEREDFDLCENNDIGTVFFEVDDSASSSNFDLSFVSNQEINKFINGNYSAHNITKSQNDLKYKSELRKLNTNGYDDLKNEMSSYKKLNVSDNRDSMLKRKGICSSQEMLHLVDIMNDNISAEQIDELAKSLVELGGEICLKTKLEQEDNSKLLEQFPDTIDDKLLENIDAAIYENQIIFQERIRKNQLTIQNLKLQDQLLSKYMADFKVLPCNEILSIRDYENMCYTNISRQNRGMKHWRNYLNNIETNNHDNSTVQHSSFYVNTNTLSNSLTDLYINETENDSSLVDDHPEKMSDKTSNTMHKTVRWRSKLVNENESCYCDELSDDFYVNMETGACALPEKNILVETINKINVDSPIKNLLVNKPQTFTHNGSHQAMDKHLNRN